MNTIGKNVLTSSKSNIDFMPKQVHYKHEHSILESLRTYGEMNQTEISEKTQLSMNSVQATILRLVRDGIVKSRRKHGVIIYYLEK